VALLLHVQEICVEYCKNVEALCSHQHHQHMGKKQLLVQLGPNMQRLQTAMLEVQSAIAGMLQPQQQLTMVQQQQLIKAQPSTELPETTQQQQQLIAAVHEESASPPPPPQQQQQQQAFGSLLSPSQQQQQQFGQQHKPNSKPGQIRPGYVELLNQQAGVKRYGSLGATSHSPMFSKQQLQREDLMRQLLAQHPSWISENLLGGLLNVSLQVAQLQELVPSVTSGCDTSAAAQITSSPKATDKPSGLGFGDSSAASDELPHLVLQLLGASSAAVQLQSLVLLERLVVEPANAQCLAGLGVVPRLTQLLAGSGAAEQSAAAGILKHLASGG
jgi:hypothetical protein